jgi:hypothetical protein
MVYTRGQKSESSSISAAAQALLALRGPLSFTRYTLAQSSQAAPTHVASTPSQGKFWTEWTNWYHAFLAEVTDEFPSLPVAERRSQATSRWVSYTAKQLHCPEPQVRAWLRTADQKDLASAYA